MILRYLPISVVTAVTLAVAAEGDANRAAVQAVPPITKKGDGRFFPHRTDIPKSAVEDPTFKIFRVLDRTKASHPRGLKGKYEMSVAFIVEADGAVREAKVLKPSGSDALDAAYLEMIKKWKFAPAELSGKPIPFQVVQPFKVEL
jgi:TonB family protein